LLLPVAASSTHSVTLQMLLTMLPGKLQSTHPGKDTMVQKTLSHLSCVISVHSRPYSVCDPQTRPVATDCGLAGPWLCNGLMAECTSTMPPSSTTTHPHSTLKTNQPHSEPLKVSRRRSGTSLSPHRAIHSAPISPACDSKSTAPSSLL
jgi:hypothetical protein